MADNFIQDGRKMNLTVTAGYDSGDPEVINSLHGVLLTNADSSNEAAVDVGPGVYDLSVKGVNDSGNVAVSIGDAIYFTRTDTPKLSKKSTGTFFGIALEAIDSGSTDTINVLVLNINMPLGGVVNALISDDTIRQTKLDRDFIFEEFESNPVTAKVAGGAASGTGGHQNAMLFEDNAFEYSPKGTQTITAPSLAAGGLDVGMDQADNDGVEITNGITARSRAAFVVGTSPAFYAKAKFKIPDVSGTDDFAFGFRKAEAYQGNLDDYDEMACLNVISGNINIETILNGDTTDTTDTTDDWADNEEHTLEVYVSAAGVVTYKINGAAPTVPAAFTFDADEVVVPFFFMLHATAAQAGSVLLESWEVGLQ